MFLKIDAFLPFKFEETEINDYSQLLIDELLSVSEKIIIPIDNLGEVSVKIKTVSHDKKEKLKIKYPSYFDMSFKEIIHFRFEIPVTNKFEKISKSYSGPLNKLDVSKIHINNTLRPHLINFIKFTQLSIPGSLNTGKGLIIKDNGYYNIIPPLNSCLDLLIYSENKEWPFTKRIPLLKVWDYIRLKTQILSNSPKSNIERGLNAFTYLFDNPYDSVHNIVWAMLGIEALYNNDKDLGIISQIDKKAKIFLGEPTENKSIIKKLYKFRSNFLHGSMSFPINGGSLSNESQNKYDDEFFSKEFDAYRLLTSSLQTIIENDMDYFEFELKLK